MKATTKKLMMLSYNYYKEIEQTLEAHAAKGLVLEKIGIMFWSFTKMSPQSLKYAVTYFNEGSVFNPHPTDNQMTYFEYAKAAGWDYVCEYGKMQIFSSSAESPAPFETDEGELLTNIHKCMKKSFIPSQFLMLTMWLLNLGLRIDSFYRSPLDFFSSNLDIVSLLLFFSISAYTAYLLINYYSWYYRSKKSIAMGGECTDAHSNRKKYFDYAYVGFLFLLVVYMFLDLSKNTSYGIIALSCIQLPLFILAFYGSIKLLKRLNITAMVNMIVSIALLLLTFVLYLGVVFYSVANFNFTEMTDKAYTTVEWEVFSGETREYRLYQDKLPLSCEDLYGEIDFPNYSYEANLASSVFLDKAEYSQTAMPMKNPPPELEYTVFTPKFKFVYSMIFDELTTLDEWQSKKAESMDNSIFGTEEAYLYYYSSGDVKDYSGEYLLIFKDRLIHISADDPFTTEQIEVVKSKLLPQI